MDTNKQITINQDTLTVSEQESSELRTGIADKLIPLVPAGLVTAKPSLQRMKTDAATGSASAAAITVESGQIAIAIAGRVSLLTAATALGLWRVLDSFRPDVSAEQVTKETCDHLVDEELRKSSDAIQENSGRIECADIEQTLLELGRTATHDFAPDLPEDDGELDNQLTDEEQDAEDACHYPQLTTEEKDEISLPWSWENQTIHIPAITHPDRTFLNGETHPSWTQLVSIDTRDYYTRDGWQVEYDEMISGWMCFPPGASLQSGQFGYFETQYAAFIAINRVLDNTTGDTTDIKEQQ